MDCTSSVQAIIPLSKKKLVLLLFGAIAFVGGSTWMWSHADVQSRFSPHFVKAVAVAGISFFGLSAIYVGYKVFDSRPGLIIDSLGIIDNSSAVAAGRIFWHDIVGLNVSTISRQRFIVIEVVDPQEFIERGNLFRRILNTLNMKMMGSPIAISSNSLRANFDQLVALLTDAFEKQTVSGDATRIRHSNSS
jgi:hypothetical protein